MIGLGVGIDYALFMVTRYRAELAGGFLKHHIVAVGKDKLHRFGPMMAAVGEDLERRRGLLALAAGALAASGLGANRRPQPVQGQAGARFFAQSRNCFWQ